MKCYVFSWLCWFWLAGGLPLAAQTIHEAAATGDVEKVRDLLKGDPTLADLRYLGNTPLHEAARGGSLEVVKVLVAAGADINAKNSSGLTPLKLALGYERKQVAAWLKEHGALVTVPATVPVRTNLFVRPVVPELPKVPAAPLLPAISEPPIQPVINPAPAVPSDPKTTPGPKPPQALPAPPTTPKAAKPAATLPSLDPVVFPIHQAAEVGDTEQIRALLKAWPELLEAQNEKGLTPLHVAAANARKDAVEALLARRANVQAETKYGWVPLHFAVTKGDAATVTLLLAYGAPANVKTHTGETPLHMAARGGHLEVARLLLQRKADPDAVEKTTSSTPLHLAVVRGQEPMIELLIAAGADVNVLDNRGDTPLNLALASGRDPVAALLRKHGAHEPPAKPLSPLEQSLVDHYRKLDGIFRTGTPSEKRRAAMNLLPTRADAQKLFPQHAATAANVVDELQQEVKRTSDKDFGVEKNEGEIWKMQTSPASPYVLYCQSKGLIAPDVPIYTLTVKKKGLKNAVDMYCFVNNRWVPLPPLSRILPPP